MLVLSACMHCAVNSEPLSHQLALQLANPKPSMQSTPIKNGNGLPKLQYYNPAVPHCLRQALLISDGPRQRAGRKLPDNGLIAVVELMHRPLPHHLALRSREAQEVLYP